MGKRIAKTSLPSVSILTHSAFKRACMSCFAVALLSSMTAEAYAQVYEKKGKTVRGGGNSSPEKVTFKGLVYDEELMPLPGAHVRVKGDASKGTVTNEQGEFQLTLPAGNYTLEISYVGMKTASIKARVGRTLQVQLEPDAQTLKETVVTGIYTRNIESFTGSVSTFTGEELKSVGPQNILKSLSVLDPSFILTDNNLTGSNPNTLMDVSINGKINVTDLTQEYSVDPNQPLFILDGFESTLQEIQDLNMDRVESISILKDAASTAIYGSKAANGVVVVETIKPKAGKLRFSYNGNFTFSWPDLTDYNLMNAEEKLQFEKLAGMYKSYDSSGAWVNLDENGEIIGEAERASYYAKLKLVREGHDTYWLNEPLRYGFTQAHNVYVDGGDQTFLYGVGLSYNNTMGVMKNSDRDVVNANIRLTYRLKNLLFTNQATFSNTTANNNTVDFSAFSRMNPFYDKTTESGQIPKYVYRDGVNYIWNPMWDFNQNSYNQSENWSLTDNFQLEWTIINSLRFRANLQYQLQKSDTEVFRSPNETSFNSTASDQRGTFRKNATTSTLFTGRLNLTYGRTFGKHTINGVAGMQFRDDSRETYGFSAEGYSTDQFSSPNFSNGYPEEGRPTAQDDKSRSVSYYLNFNYSYLMRYLLDFNYTSNGASQFGINDPFTTTWSVGVGWNLHEENFLKDNKIINYFKIRYSLGNPGNQNYDAKLSSSIYSYITSGTNPFGLAALIETWGNNNLKWQRTVTHNFGVNLQLFGNRLNIDADYQIRRTDPLLVTIDLPASTGSTTAPMNIGATDNRSFSLSLTYYLIRRQRMNWFISANLNHNTTKYYNIGNTLEAFNEAGRASSSLLRYYDNGSTTGLYVVRSAGIDPATGNEIFIKKDGTYTYEWNQDDEVLYGDTNPDISGAFNTSFVWKDFSVGASFTYRMGGDVQLSTLLNKVENINSSSLQYNQDRRALYDRWQKPGDNAKFKRIDDTSVTNMSSRFVATENTLECSSINIGYRTSTAPWLKYIKATSVNFRIYMNNIFRISTIKEERGTNYPFERSITCSIGFNF